MTDLEMIQRAFVHHEGACSRAHGMRAQCPNHDAAAAAFQRMKGSFQVLQEAYAQALKELEEK